MSMNSPSAVRGTVDEVGAGTLGALVGIVCRTAVTSCALILPPGPEPEKYTMVHNYKCIQFSN